MNQIQIPGVGIEIGLEVRDKNGNILFQKTEEGHSFIQNFMIILAAAMRGNNAGLTLVDTGNASRVGVVGDDWTATSMANMAALGDGTSKNYGIFIGTSNTAVTTTDYNLIAKLTTNWTYAAPTQIASSSDAGLTFSTGGVSRTFTNGTGASVVVYEVGLVVATRWAAAQRNVLIARDVLAAPGVTVIASGTLSVQYKIKATV